MTVVPGAVCHVLYEDLTWQHDVLSRYDTLPEDGVMGLQVNGTPYAAMQHYFFAPDEQGTVVGFSNDSKTDISLRYPGAKILRGKTTTTRRFHESEVELGLWAKENKKHEPFDGWVKDVIGWKLWTSKELGKEPYSSKGVLPGDWKALWDSLPTDDIQFIMLYENWEFAPGRPYRQVISGSDVYFMAPGPDNRWIIAGTASQDDENEVATRYPGSSIKRGKFMNVTRLRELRKEVMASVSF